jgi:predicted RNase H-like HicB family nuclease
MEIVFSIRKSPEGGYVACAVGYNIFTQADTIDQLKLNAQDAVRCHFDEGTVLPEILLVEAPPNGRRFGSAKGEFTVPDDFNDPLPKEIEDLFYK